MHKTTKTIRRMFILSGFAVMTASASAFSFDQQIMIDRAINSPTLTVRFSSATAALVELRLNGESIATRSISGNKNFGETNFTLNPSDLKDGDNEVEIRLYDRTGKLIAKDKTNISTEQSQQGPLFVTAPKMGSTIQGTTEIKLGFTQDLKNPYISFFVDGTFKSGTNVAPYAFFWDTEKESNGWHEIEAWALDQADATHKTKKLRLFVNNPGGRTNRVGAAQPATPSKNRIRSTDIVGAEAGLRGFNVKTTSKTANGNTSNNLPPAILARLSEKSNGLRVTLASPAGSKPVRPAYAIATGPKLMMPTGRRVATIKATAQPIVSTASTTKVTTPTAVAPVLQPVVRGTRLPNMKTLTIMMDKEFVNFDVTPRIENGIPMAPFRHLIEKAGGEVKWFNSTKTVLANADGHKMELKIGDKTAKYDKSFLNLEIAPYIERGRTIVPVSFLHDALKVNVEFDKETGHVLITSASK